MEKYELQKLRDLPIEGVAERLGRGIKASARFTRTAIQVCRIE